MRLFLTGWSAALLALGLGGCSLNYGNDKPVPSDQVPLMVFTDLKQTSVRDNLVQYTVESGYSEVYDTRKEMRLKDFRFQEYDSTGTAVSTGQASAAVINTATNDAVLTGILRARSAEQGVGLEIDGGAGGALTWTNEGRLLKTGPEATVTLTKEDGSTIRARGLVLDLAANQLELEEGVQGTWTPETKENAENPSPALPPAPSPPAP